MLKQSHQFIIEEQTFLLTLVIRKNVKERGGAEQDKGPCFVGIGSNFYFIAKNQDYIRVYDSKTRKLREALPDDLIFGKIEVCDLVVSEDIIYCHSSSSQLISYKVASQKGPRQYFSSSVVVVCFGKSMKVACLGKVIILYKYDKSLVILSIDGLGRMKRIIEIKNTPKMSLIQKIVEILVAGRKENIFLILTKKGTIIVNYYSERHRKILKTFCYKIRFYTSRSEEIESADILPSSKAQDQYITIGLIDRSNSRMSRILILRIKNKLSIEEVANCGVYTRMIHSMDILKFLPNANRDGRFLVILGLTYQGNDKNRVSVFYFDEFKGIVRVVEDLDFFLKAKKIYKAVCSGSDRLTCSDEDASLVEIRLEDFGEKKVRSPAEKGGDQLGLKEVEEIEQVKERGPSRGCVLM